MPVFLCVSHTNREEFCIFFVLIYSIKEEKQESIPEYIRKIYSRFIKITVRGK